ncbi:MAG TPA: hypothetical protein VN578_01710 [Candidatus Binatia bacterium]|nr:hypothetical protein [Candidatus Binatia bacterium]
MKTFTFGELPLGTPFLFRGRRFTKTARNMAEDEERYPFVFLNVVPAQVDEAAEESSGEEENPS